MSESRGAVWPHLMLQPEQSLFLHSRLVEARQECVHVQARTVGEASRSGGDPLHPSILSSAWRRSLLTGTGIEAHYDVVSDGAAHLRNGARILSESHVCAREQRDERGRALTKV